MEWAKANEASEVGSGCRGDGMGERVGSVISRSFGVEGRGMGRAIQAWLPRLQRRILVLFLDRYQSMQSRVRPKGGVLEAEGRGRKQVRPKQVPYS